MKTDLSQATFIIPVRIESQDRMRNVITSVCFLLKNFDTNIIIKEVDQKPIVAESVLPQVYDFCGDVRNKINYIFVESNDPLFHRQKILNQMIEESKTDIVVNYDCDVVLPLDSYKLAYQGILNQVYDVVYPYGSGMYQKQVKATDKLVTDFLISGDYSVLDNNSSESTSDFGWAQFFRRRVYIEGGMENENFKAYAPEDKERFYRFTTLGYNVGRINNFVYHLEHARGENSWFNNPHMQSNMDEWKRIQSMNKEQLLDYYSQQEYLKKYAGI